jgi:RNA polymerase sigma-70 factor (ECF subfamily)
VAHQVDLFEEQEYRSFLVNRALELMRSEFRDETWQACWQHVVEGRTAAEVGSALGISANAVRVAKCRVLRRLREELDGLLD